MTPAEVACALKVDTEKVYELIARGDLIAVNVGLGTTPRWRIGRADLDAFLRARVSHPQNAGIIG